MFPMSSLVHFILVEQRSLFLSMIGFRGVVTTIVLDNLLTHADDTDCKRFWEEVCSIPPDAFQAVPRWGGYDPKIWCSEQALDEHECQKVIDLQWTGTTPRQAFHGLHAWAGSWLDLPHYKIFSVMPPKSERNLAVFIATPVECYVLVFVIANVVAFARNGYTDFRSGGYVAFTWDLENRLFYKIFARGLVVFTVGLICFVCSFGVLLGPTDGGALFSSFWTAKFELMTFFAGIISLNVSPDGHAFSHDTKQFFDRRFKRSWFRLVTQSNDQFALRIDDALVHFMRGNQGPLAAIDEDPAEFQQICFSREDDFETSLALLSSDES